MINYYDGKLREKYAMISLGVGGVMLEQWAEYSEVVLLVYNHCLYFYFNVIALKICDS